MINDSCVIITYSFLFCIIVQQSFQSQKLAVKAKRQLQDVFSVLAGNLPSWLIQLISVCPFLFPFDIRRTFFYAHNFDRNRALLRFQVESVGLFNIFRNLCFIIWKSSTYTTLCCVKFSVLCCINFHLFKN